MQNVPKFVSIIGMGLHPNFMAALVNVYKRSVIKKVTIMA